MSSILNKESLTRLWDNVNWSDTEDEVFRLQKKIVAAVHCRDYKYVAQIQKELVKSISARMLAVRHVAAASSSPGPDGKRWVTSHQKMAAAFNLNSEDYKAGPTRLFVVQSKRDKERNIKLANLSDRAMQTLHSYALSPVAETLADKKSFAFRRGRSPHDAHFYVAKLFTGEDAPKYVVKADIQAHYESICHRWLRRHIPMDKHVLSEFLNAGYVFDGELYPPMEYGISIGSGISPILANMSLDGIQNAVYTGLHKRGAIDYADGDLVRYADDIIVSVRSKESARKVIDILYRFLRVRGLTLSPTKTQIIRVKDGFEFLSRRYQRIDGMIFACPSDSAVSRFETVLTAFIRGYKGSQLSLIEELNRKLSGWAGFHKFVDAGNAFRYIDSVVSALLLELCKSKHKSMKLETIIKRYFIQDADGVYVYTAKDQKGARVIRLAKTPLVVHKPISLYRNPYIDTEYFKQLADEREVSNVVGKYRAVWTRQDGRCFYCGAPILPDQLKGIYLLDCTKPASQSNLVYVHSRCAVKEMDWYRDKAYYAQSTEITSLLEQIADGDTYSGSNYRFEKLKSYLWEQTRATVILNFSEIEQIIGYKLPAHSKVRSWWYRQWAGGIYHVGSDTGYLLVNVDFYAEKAIFKRDENACATVAIPRVFLRGKVPVDAATEIAVFLEYIRKKYGI